MSAAPHADLSGLLRGELRNDEVADTGTHLRRCAGCRDDLVETAVGHALLTRTSIFERRRRRRWHLAGTAAAVLLAGGAGALVQANLPDEPSSTSVAATRREATLRAVTGEGGGSVEMAESGGRTTMTISTRDLPVTGRGEYYYAWLLDPATNKMLPLGQVGPSGTASFEVSAALLAAYSAVDVSLEADDGDPQHSPTSVLRATYA